MRFRLFFLFLTILNGYQYCPKPTFVDEFDKGLSVMWETTTDKHAPGSVSLYTPFNVKTEAGKLVLSVNKIGTTDSNGEFYPSTSAEIFTKAEFGYGKYEFRVTVIGLEPVTEELELIWYDGDYYTDHQLIGFKFLPEGYFTKLGVTVDSDDEINVYHSTEVDEDFEPVKLNLKTRSFAIEYLPDKVSWSYDGKIVRQETNNSKPLPTHKMRILFRNWLVEKLQYKIPDEDMPVKTKVDFVKFTPIDLGKDSCKKVLIPNNIDEDDENNYEELIQILENLEPDQNYLIGCSEGIKKLSIFKSVRVVWIYLNGRWQAYSPYLKIREILKKYNIPIFSEIPPYTGFWIQK